MNAIDTNVFVYALSQDEPVKQAAAVALLGSLNPDETVVLWQVAVELGAVITRRINAGRADPGTLELARDLRDRFPLVLPSPSLLDTGPALRERYQLSYWDAMLIAAAQEAGVRRLYSQDVQSAPVIERVAIINPFAA